MANITLGQLRDLWKNVSDWVTGVATHEPKVQLSGRNVQPTIRQINPGLLESGQEYAEPSAVDLLASPGVMGIALAVDADLPVQVQFLVAAGGGTNAITNLSTGRKLSVVLPQSVGTGLHWFLPPFRLYGGRYMWVCKNPTDAAYSRLSVVEFQYRYLPAMPQNLRAVMIRPLVIRDTSAHTVDSDPLNIYGLLRTILGGGKVPIYVYNSLDQAVTISPVLELGGVGPTTLGSKDVAAGTNYPITNADFPGLDVPSEEIRLIAKCNTAPTSGSLSAYIDTLVGGGA